MSYSEADLRQRINGLSKEFPFNMYKLAEERIRRFSAVIYRLLKEENETYSIIASGGNSGTVFIYFTKKVYKKLGLPFPKTLLLPVCRDYLSASKHQCILLEESRKQLKGVNSINKVLFVDDEIMSAVTANACFRSIVKALNIKDKTISATIVAENHFFEWHYNNTNVAIKYFSYANFIPTKHHLYSYLLKDADYEEIKNVLGNEISRNDLWSVIIGGTLKECSENEASFTKKEAKLLEEKMANFQSIKSNILTNIDNLLSEGIEMYKKKEISFKF